MTVTGTGTVADVLHIGYVDLKGHLRQQLNAIWRRVVRYYSARDDAPRVVLEMRELKAGEVVLLSVQEVLACFLCHLGKYGPAVLDKLQNL